MKKETSIKTLQKLDIRTGEVVKAEENTSANDDCYKVEVDFGEELGVLKTSAKVTDRYSTDELVGKTVLGVVNFPDKQIADMMSEFLLLGAVEEKGVSVLTTDKEVEKGTKIA